MIDGSEKRSRQLAFELQNSHVREKHSKSVKKTACSTLPFYVQGLKWNH